MFLNPVLQVFMSFVGLYMSYASQVESRVIFSVLFMLDDLIDEDAYVSYIDQRRIRYKP